MRPRVTREDEVSDGRVKFSEFSTLRNCPPTLTSHQLGLVLFRIGLDVDEELDDVAERVQSEQLLRLANALETKEKRLEKIHKYQIRVETY